MKKKSNRVKPESILYEVIKEYPLLRKKIAELFGKKCLTCPSSKKETLAYTAFHKGYDPEHVVRELNQILSDGK